MIATFVDLDDPDRFVWLRGFVDMATRAAALGAFYGGPIWKAHRDAANATIVDSDNVLLQAAGCLDQAEWCAHLSGEATQVRLAPTPRSALRRRQALESQP